MFKHLTLVGVVLCIALCAGTVATVAGSATTCEAIDSVKIGMDRAEVAGVLGRPTAVDNIYEGQAAENVVGHVLLYRWRGMPFSVWTETTQVYLKQDRVVLVIWKKYMFASIAGRMLKEMAIIRPAQTPGGPPSREETLLFRWLHRCD